LIADRIIEEAKKAGIPIREDKALAEALAGLELGAQVPEALWVAVAEALVWAYRLDSRQSTVDSRQR
jgi:flagellar biosynthesis protein